MEPIASMAAVRRGNGRGAVAALFERDVAVGRVVVGGRELEFDPGGWEGGAALDAAFEGAGEGDEGGGGGADGGGFFGVGEVGAGGAVAVPGMVLTGWVDGGREREKGGGSLPEIVVEVVGAGFVGFVGEDDAGAAVVVLARGVLDEALLGWAVRHAGVVAGCCVGV